MELMNQVLVKYRKGLSEVPGDDRNISQQGKTQEVKPEDETLHRSGHSVNGIIDLVFV